MTNKRRQRQKHTHRKCCTLIWGNEKSNDGIERYIIRLFSRSFFLSICLFFRAALYLSVFICMICLFGYTYIHLSLSFQLSTCLSTSLSIYLLINVAIYLSLSGHICAPRGQFEYSSSTYLPNYQPTYKLIYLSL